MAEDNKTEKATEHRRHKAREEGQVARSRELSATAAMLTGILVLVAQEPAGLMLWRQFFRAVLDSRQYRTRGMNWSWVPIGVNVQRFCLFLGGSPANTAFGVFGQDHFNI